MSNEPLQALVDYLNFEASRPFGQPIDDVQPKSEVNASTAKVEIGNVEFLITVPPSPTPTLLNQFRETAKIIENEPARRSELYKERYRPSKDGSGNVGGKERFKRRQRNDHSNRKVAQTDYDGSVASSSMQPGPQTLPDAEQRPCNKELRERLQRVCRDTFKKRVLELADSWIHRCNNGNWLKQYIVVNEDSCKPKSDRLSAARRQTTGGGERRDDHDENRSEVLFSKQNGYFYYHILCTKEVENMVAIKRVQRPGERDMDVLVDRLAIVGDIYLRVMFNNDVRPSVFIKFDDMNIPALFARQTKQSLDTCITGSPGRYWTKVLHLDGLPKTSQHITLQRVRSGRLIQDSSFVVVGEGGVLHQMYSLTPECFVSPSRNRRSFKEMYRYIMSIPENDLSYVGWEVFNDMGVVDPIKTFLPKILSAEERPAEDAVFVNYIDMFVTMLVHRHKMELPRTFDQSLRQLKVFRTEYKYELSGRADHPGFYLYRNDEDYITDLTMVNMTDDLYDAHETRRRMLSDDGIYFYDVQSVSDVLIKLQRNGVTNVTVQDDFYKYIVSECEDVVEMVAFSDHTIHTRLQDALDSDLYLRLHETDPARWDPLQCSDKQNDVSIGCSMCEYRSTYYIEKSNRLTRVFNQPPTDLDARDFVLRCYRLKWKGLDETRGKNMFVMYPIFCFVFKNMSRFYERVPEIQKTFTDEIIFFPEETKGCEEATENYLAADLATGTPDVLREIADTAAGRFEYSVALAGTPNDRVGTAGIPDAVEAYTASPCLLQNGGFSIPDFQYNRQLSPEQILPFDHHEIPPEELPKSLQSVGETCPPPPPLAPQTTPARSSLGSPCGRSELSSYTPPLLLIKK